MQAVPRYDECTQVQQELQNRGKIEQDAKFRQA